MKRLRIGKWELRLAHQHDWAQVDMDGDFSDWLCAEVRKILEKHGCGHGHDLSNTPPMFYPEAIVCALHHQREQGRADGSASWASEVSP